jgi:ATP-dependent Clp protease protease subunit
VNMKNKFWRFNAAADGDSAELLLYGTIADESWWSDEISPKQFSADLAALGNIKNLTLRINSYGGDVFAANAMFNILKQHPAKVTVRIDGIAASAATIVMLAGDEVVMPVNAMIMIHNPWTIAMGDAREMRAAADLLDTVRDTILATYQTKTGLSRQELINMMNSETWMTADEAVDKGFADKVETDNSLSTALADGKLVVNGLPYDLSKFRLVPAALLKSASQIPPSGGNITGASASESKSTEVNNMTLPAGSAAPNAPAPEPQAPEQPTEQPVDQEPTAGVAQESTEGAQSKLDADPKAAAERARMKAIDELAAKCPGSEALAFKAKYETGISAEQFAVEILNSDDVRNKSLLAARKADSQTGTAAPQGSQKSEQEAAAEMIAAGANARRR